MVSQASNQTFKAHQSPFQSSEGPCSEDEAGDGGDHRTYEPRRDYLRPLHRLIVTQSGGL